MKCSTCGRKTCTLDPCAICRLEESNREFTKTLLDIVRPVNMNDLPNPYDSEEREKP